MFLRWLRGTRTAKPRLISPRLYQATTYQKPPKSQPVVIRHKLRPMERLALALLSPLVRASRDVQPVLDPDRVTTDTWEWLDRERERVRERARRGAPPKFRP